MYAYWCCVLEMFNPIGFVKCMFKYKIDKVQMEYFIFPMALPSLFRYLKKIVLQYLYLNCRYIHVHALVHANVSSLATMNGAKIRGKRQIYFRFFPLQNK